MYFSVYNAPFLTRKLYETRGRGVIQGLFSSRNIVLPVVVQGRYTKRGIIHTKIRYMASSIKWGSSPVIFSTLLSLINLVMISFNARSS